MKPVKNIIRKMVKSRRGNALILAILATMLLFIIGMAFLSSTIMEKSTVVNLDQQDILDNGIEIVMDRISDVLMQDLFGNGNNLLDGRGDSVTNPFNISQDNESYDYPGPDDPWLASLEPDIFYDAAGTPWHSWPHITDLWNQFGPADDLTLADGTTTEFGISNYAGPMERYFYDPDFDPPDPWMESSFFEDHLSTDSHPYWVSAYNMVAKIIQSEERIENTLLDANPNAYFRILSLDFSNSPNGMRADADGDGVADSRWVRLDRIGPKDQWLWAAVRIIDNCGMINLNTAFRNPDPTDVPNNNTGWDGTQLTHINLETMNTATSVLSGIRKNNNESLMNLQAARYGTVLPFDAAIFADYNNDILYQDNVARRVPNPFVPVAGQFYAPFDITDELNLRNRFFLFPSSVSRSELEWPYTFPRRTATQYWGRFLPYDDPTKLPAWFDKSQRSLIPAFIQYYNHRHICTTYSFDRIMTPKVSTTNMDSELLGPPIPTPPPGTPPSTWNEWTLWNKTQVPRRWSYRPVCVNDAVVMPNLHKPLAAALWLGIRQAVDEFSFIQTSGSKNKLTTSSDMIDMDWVPSAGSNDDKNNKLRNRLACQMAANLIDYIDTNTTSTKIEANGNEFFGFESGGPRPVIVRLGISKYDDTAPLDDADAETHYAIAIYNAGAAPITINSSWKLKVKGSSDEEYDLLAAAESDVILIAGQVAVFIDQDLAAQGFEKSMFPVNDVRVIDGSFEFEDNDEITLIGNDGHPWDQVKVEIDSGDIDMEDLSAPKTGIRGIWTGERTLRSGNNKIGINAPAAPADQYIPNQNILVWKDENDAWSGPDESNTYGNLGGAINTGSMNPPIAPVTAEIPIQCRDSASNRIDTVGEVYNVLFLGDHKFDDEYTTMNECWFKLLDHATTPANDFSADEIYKGRFIPTAPNFMYLTQFVTVMNPFSDLVNNDGRFGADDPASDGFDNDDDGTTDSGDPEEVFAYYSEEQQVAGRININTAPWYVIAQLPWIQDPDPLVTLEDKLKLARAIAAYRDKKDLIDLAGPTLIAEYSLGRGYGMDMANPDPPIVREKPGFASLTELLNVTYDLSGGPVVNPSYDPYYDIRRYGRDLDASNQPLNNNQAGTANQGPFYSEDEAANDIEERDILFKRISNLATVRSDVFTAYILVRLGRDGPQKRMMAIFDRSNVFRSSDKPKLVALHPVPDPR